MELLDMAVIARELGVSKQAIWDRWKRGTMPKPDATLEDKPLWKRKTLEKTGILKG